MSNTISKNLTKTYKALFWASIAWFVPVIALLALSSCCNVVALGITTIIVFIMHIVLLCLFVFLKNSYMLYYIYNKKNNISLIKICFGLCILMICLSAISTILFISIFICNANNELVWISIPVAIELCLLIVIYSLIHKDPEEIKNKKGNFANKNIKSSPNEISNRRWTTALLLCIFLGAFGFHRYYVGKTRYATVTLVLTLLGIGIVIFLIPNLVDLVKICSHSYLDYNGKLITDIK